MEKEKGLKQNIQRTWKYIKKAKLNLLGYFLVSLFEAFVSLAIPLLSAKVILNITNGVVNQIVLSAVVVFVIEVLLNSMNYFKTIYFQKIYQTTLVGIQKEITKEILNLEQKEIDKNTSGLFIERANKDVQDIAVLFMEYTYWISYIVSNVGVLATIFILNKYIFAFSLITALVVYMIHRKSLNKQYEVQAKLRKIQEEKTGHISELVKGIKDIKGLNAHGSFLKHTYTSINTSAKQEIKIMQIKKKYTFLEDGVNSIAQLGFVLLSTLLYTKTLLTIPSFVILFNYQSKVRNLLMGIAQISEYNKKFNMASNRVFEVIEDNKFKKEKFGDITLKDFQGNIQFENVKFGYEKDIPVLKGMNFDVLPNERVAFVGKSGAGKSTIFNLISKLYDVTGGKILLDGCEIHKLSKETIRKNITVIPQNPYIFNFSIKENLQLANEKASFEEIRKACKLACIDEYIMSLPDKYDTQLGENGVMLSGGQKQRLAIARALLTDTKIILLDEATSALDNETQEMIQQAIENLQGNYTICIIAHRLSTVINSNKIFVVQDGKVIASGTHEELIQSCPFYKKIYSNFNS